MKKKLKLDDVEVAFDSTPLTEDEKSLISEFIRQDKEKRRKNTVVNISQHNASPAGNI